MKFGDIVKDLRKEHGYTQLFVAEKTGISRSVLSQYENNLVDPTSFVIVKFAKFFNVSTDFLLGLEDELGARTFTPAPSSSISDKEQALLNAFRKLPADSQKLVLRMVGVSSEEATASKKA